MKKSKAKKENIILTIFIFAILGTTIKLVLFPAFTSLMAACFIKEENLANYGIVVYGQFAVRMQNITTENNITIQKAMPIIEIYDNNPETYFHEYCHFKQYKEKGIYSCSNIWGVYANEVECYFRGMFI